MHVNPPVHRFVWKLAELADADVLAGVHEGRKALGSLFLRAAGLPPGSVVLIDFRGVRAATASFLRESVVAFRSQSRRQEGGAYPVLCNVPAAVGDELRLLGEVWPVIEVDQGTGKVLRRSIEGDLDPKQRAAFELVDEHGPIDVKSLSELSEDEAVQLPAWHNRIRALIERGLVVERSGSRGRLIESVLKVV